MDRQTLNMRDFFDASLRVQFLILVMGDLFIPQVNEVTGYLLKGLTALANKPPTKQIFALKIWDQLVHRLKSYD